MADERIFFPYEKIRDEQNKLIFDVNDTLLKEVNLLVHAPTGIGKTISTLGPALKYALENHKTVFFLTSRHTQHILALRTLKDIKNKFGTDIQCCDIIGKKWMCGHDGAENIPSNEFSEYCKALRKDDLCEFYNNTRPDGKLTVTAQSVISQIKSVMPADTETINMLCRKHKLCPYEIATLLAKDAHVIIGDYNYVFDSAIRTLFFQKANKTLPESILIIDEGHNLPDRCREMLSENMSTIVLSRSVKEAEKFGFDDVREKLKKIMRILHELGSELDSEKREDFVLKNEFIKKVEKHIPYDQTAEMFEIIGDEIREHQRQSYIGSIGRFMHVWKGSDNGFCRTVDYREMRNDKIYTLNYRCLDPSLISKDVVNGTLSTIIMSGTLTPAEMYADILGFKNYSIKEYKDPFSQQNRINLIIDEVTTKFTARNQEQYKKIAEICVGITNNVPGNTFVFFPSYQVRDAVYRYFEGASSKMVFLEMPGMSKEEKQDFLEKFKKQKDKGAVMLGAAQGNFGEGVDLPGDLLKCVIVVGVPLQNPDLETKELISYYEEKYGQGINYGYIFPAITKTMQNAGRCIRSEKDRGVIIFMDVRYTWENYKKCFPVEWNMKITKMWNERIIDFFKQKIDN